MELKINQSLLIFSFFSLIFFLNVAESICVPRHASKQADSPDQASKLQPQSSSPRPQQVSSSPPKSESSPPPKSSSSSSSSSSSPSSSSSSPSSSSPSSSPSSSSSSSPSPSSSSPSPSSSSSSSSSSPTSSSSSSSSSSPTSSSSSFPPPPASVPASDSPDGMTTLDTHSTGKGPGFLAKTIKPFLDHQMDQMDGALTHICKQTDFSDLCLSSLAPFFDGNSDPVSMLSVAIKACTQHAQLSLDTAQKIAATPSTNPITASKLSDCQDSYSDALDNLQAANDALGVRDFGKINSMLSAVVTDASDCEDQFPGKSSPMLDFEVKLHQMASNCLAIASLAM